MRYKILAGFMVLAILAAVGCAPQRPVLYPNSKLNSVGTDAAQADIDECIRMAEANGATDGSSGGKIAKDTAKGAVIAGVAGAAVGAIFGNWGRGALVGAVGGGVASGTRSAWDSNNPDPIFKEFVNRCLREKGYEPIGWK
jgi:hypothetical protein